MNTEEIAKQISEMQDQLRDVENSKGKNWMLPKPPEPGEIIYCKVCKQPMLPKDFSEDTNIRKKEFKWQMHWKCMQSCFDQCDIQTPGLLSERKNGINAGRDFRIQNANPNRH